MDVDPATRSLRSGSAEVLEAAIVDVLVSGEQEWLSDWRDLLVTLAPFHDCARRIGAEPSAVFARAAAAGPPSLRETVAEFGARTDVTPGSFAFVLEQTPDGPRYRCTLGDP